MIKKVLLLLLCILLQLGAEEEIFYNFDEAIVLETRKITLEEFPDAFNPSLIKIDQGFLLTFRYCPDRINQSWLSEIGIVLLDPFFNPISKPQLVSTRIKRSKTPSQAEDARLFTYKNKLFLIYNDNVDEIFYDSGKRRDIFITELLYEEAADPFTLLRFKLGPSLKLFCEEKYHQSWQQKNWIPFEYQNGLFFIYSLHPHEVLGSNLRNGACYSLYKTPKAIDWKYGTLRGSSAAQIVDGEYLAFFHSGSKMRSPASYEAKLWHYFAGAYTFSPHPPFEMTKISASPIMSSDFYTPSYREKRVVFPGGFVVEGNKIFLAFGKDDYEMWIATLDKEALIKSLIPVQQ